MTAVKRSLPAKSSDPPETLFIGNHFQKDLGLYSISDLMVIPPKQHTSVLTSQFIIVRPTQGQARYLIWNLALLASLLAFCAPVSGQAIPDNGASAGFGSIDAPRPINPATGTTNPSARATQNLNPYLGSTPHDVATKDTLHISLEDAIARGLQNNLDLRRGIAARINIIHINTELTVAWSRSLEESLGRDPNEVVPCRILPPAVDSVKEVIRSRLRLFHGETVSPEAIGSVA